MKKIILIISIFFAQTLFAQTISTPVPIGSISLTGSVKVTGDSPTAGQLAIDDNGTAIITRFGDKAIMTLLLHFDDDDDIIMTFGTLIVPVGGKIISVTSSSSSDSDPILIDYLSDTTIEINRGNNVNGITTASVNVIIDGYANVDIERTSKTPMELKNQQLSGGLFASDAIVDAEFTGLQRNDDRTLVEFYFTSMFLDGVSFRTNLVRVKNGVNTNLTVTKPIGDVTFVDGYADIEFTTGISALGLTNIRFRISEAQTALLGAGYTIDQTLYNSQYVFKNEIEFDLKKEIAALPTEIMGGLDDVNGFNFKDAFKEFELTSEFFELPPDNYVRMNYFSLSRASNTLYISFRVYTANDVLIKEIAGSGVWTVNITDYTNIAQDLTVDGWRLRWVADFDFLTANTLISPLTKENAAFKIPAKNTERETNYFDTRFNTLGNTVNNRNFDISRFIKDIRLIPNNKEFLLENGAIKDFRIRYFEVSPTRYYLSFQIGTDQYTGVEVAPNVTQGVFDIEFVYPEFNVVASAEWNGIANYLFDYNALANSSAMLKQQVVIDGYSESDMNSNSSGLTYNDLYSFSSSTAKTLPYLYKSINWGQSSKIPRTNFLCIPDHNDEPQAANRLLSWVKSDTAIEKAIPTVLLQGDFITTAPTTSPTVFSDKIDDWFNALPNDTPILWCNGNHDLGLDNIPSLANVPSANTRRTLIHDRLYNRLPANYQSATVRGAAIDAMYYYTDVPGTSVRVIALDQFEYPIVAGVGRPIKYSGTAIYDTGVIVAGFNMYYSEAQLNFLINALETLPSANTAIIMTHIPITSDANGEQNALANSNIALRAILKAYRDRVSATVNIDAIPEIAAFSVNMDFSSRTNSKMLYTYGHLHDFKKSIIEDAGNLVSVQCMAAGNTAPYISIDGNSISNYGGDIISIDEDKDEVYILRYGSRTRAATGIPIGLDNYGFNFISRPLKAGNN